MDQQYNIRIAHFAFSCPVCGKKVRKGENYIETEGVITCLCIIPGKRLKPLRKQTT